MNLLAGSNTVKGTINDGMDVEFALKLGKTLGETYGSPVAVAMDGRNSNNMLLAALSAGIMSVGCDVLYLGAVPTPMIQFYMSMHSEIKGGVTITASFAGQQINGFRVMKSEGVEDPIFESITVEEMMANTNQVPGLAVGEMFKIPDFTEAYVDYILSNVDVEAIRAAELKICLDCRNPAVGVITSQLLMRLSIDHIFITGDTSVLDEDRQTKLGHVVKSQELDLGVALEMDADHVLFTTSEGEVVHGDRSFAVLAKDILSKTKGKVVIPVNASTLMESVIRDNGGELVLCSIGEQAVVQSVKENDAVLGGDIFGCIVLPGRFCTCDAILAMAKIIELIAKNGPLSEQIRSYPDYFISKGSMDVPNDDIPKVLECFRSLHLEKEMDLFDGVKVYNDQGWILVRKSNVNNMIKVYAQAGSREKSTAWVQDTIDKLSEFAALNSSQTQQ